MRLHVLYRSFGGENQKGRPSYYSKRLSLISFLRSVQGVPGLDVTFVNNGPVPADRLVLMQRSGARVLQIEAPTSRVSFRYALKRAIASDWADDDVVYFVEDDYLHAPDALARLDAAVRALPEVSYFLTYGATRTSPLGSLEHYEECTPKNWQPREDRVVDGQLWRPALAPTSTYAARVGAVRQDYGIFLQSHLPYRNHYLDLQGGLVTQGYEPYRWDRLAREVVGLVPGGVKARVRAIGEAPFKVAFNLRAHRRPGRRRLMFVAEPNLATHLETEFISPGRDWETVAKDAQRFFDDGGLRAAAATGRQTAVEGDRSAERGWG